MLAHSGDTQRRRARRLAELATGGKAVRTHVLRGGFRNGMIHVECGRDHHVVVRLYGRRPDVVAIETAVLMRAATVVSVPEVLLADPDGEHTGVPALVLAYVEGVRADTVLANAGQGERIDIGRVLGGTVARLAGVRFARAGLFTDGDLRPAEHIGRMSDLLLSFVDAGLKAASDAVLPPAIKVAWRSLVASSAARVDALAGMAVLVHSDFNPKNVLLRRHGQTWAVAAVIDWEFAFAGSSLFDLGNLQRFAHRMPHGYANALGRGFAETGGVLDDDWRHAAAALDAMALGEMLQRGREAPLLDDVVEVIRRAVERRSLVLTDL